MAFGDEIITFTEQEVQFLLAILEEVRVSAEGHSSDLTEQLVNSTFSKLSNTTAQQS